MNDSPQPDTAAALAFLNALAPGEAVTFQTIDDTTNKRPELARTIHASAGEIPPDLAELNAQGAGVFFTVNRTDGKGRKAENITAVRALFVDFDTADDTRPEHMATMFDLSPSAVVESSPGKHHAYWFTDGWPLEQFTHAQATLADHYGTDKKVKDLPRVMRLPGFIHHKGAPYRTRLLELAGRHYGEAAA